MTNAGYYEGTVLDGEVPRVELGRPVRGDREFDAIRRAVEAERRRRDPAGREIGSRMQGSLAEGTAGTREAASEEAAALRGDMAAVMRWTLQRAGDAVETMHVLTADETATLETRCMSMSRRLDTVAAASGRRQAVAVDRLVDEWNRH